MCQSAFYCLNKYPPNKTTKQRRLMLCIVLCGLIRVRLMLSLLGSWKGIRSTRLAKKKNVLPLESSKREEEGLEVGAAVTFKSFYFSYAWLREGSCVCTHARYTAWRSEDNENYSFPSTVWAQQILTPGGKRFLQFSCHAGLRSPLN